jgi:glycerol kinase
MYLLALDQGTSSSRALLIDAQAQVIAVHNVPFDCDYPQPGWVEVSAERIWGSQREAIGAVLQKALISPAQVHAVGLTNQRETVIAWRRSTGQALAPAIVWQCRRTASVCERLRAEGLQAQVRERTGLLLDPYFSATKMQWLLQQPAVAAAARDGDLAFGTVDSWLLFKLSGGRLHLTDASNASRTLLFNLQTGDWDPWLLECFGIPAATLPGIVDSSGVVGLTDRTIFGAEVALAGIAGDQQAALFGQACFSPGMAKNTYGTGCFLLLNTGTSRVRSSHGLLSTVAWRLKGIDHYALEGSVFMAGALIQWLRDGLGLLRDAAESEALARSVGDSAGVHIVPAFTGLGAPHWDAEARGLICGLSRGAGRAHLARAALEAVAFQNVDLLTAMEADLGHPLRELRIDGGMVGNDFLCQFQADVLGRPVSRPRQRESTALGAALLAGLGTGVWPDLNALAGLWQEEARFEAQIDADDRASRMAGWQQAVARCLGPRQ